MTSEIRANTLKNRVGLGTVSFTNTGPVVSGIVTANTLRLPDATSGSLGRVQLGNGLHLSLYHDGSNSFLVNNNGYLSIQSQAGVNGIFIARNAEVNLYFGSSVRLQTSSSGVTINRDIDVDGHTNLDNVSIAGVTTTTEVINIDADNKKLQIGASQDLQLFHDGGHSRITNTTGILKLTAPSGSSVRMVKPDDSGNVAVFHIDAETHLYYNGAHKFSTISDGIQVVGNATINDSIIHHGDTNTKIRFPANDSISFETGGTERLRINSSGLLVPDGSASSNYISVGASQDLKLYHDGSHSYIRDTGTGGLRITTNSFNVLNSSNGESMITGTEDGAVKLYYDHNLRLETSGSRTIFRGSGGIGVYGDAGSNQNGQLTLHPTGSAVYTNLFFYNAAGNSYASIVGHDGSTLFFNGGTNGVLRHRVYGSGFHSFQDGNTERVRIDANGRLSFAGDTDTYIWHPNANELAITRAGGSRPLIRFGTGGNGTTVGINTDSNLVTNSEAFSVRGYTSFKSLNDGYAAIYTHNEEQNNSTIATHILFNWTGANRAGFGVDTDNATLIMGNQNSISFRTGATQLGGTERMLIKNTGGVGINTSLIRNDRFLNIAAPSQDFSNNSIELMDGGGICLQHTDTLASTNRTYPGIFWSGNTASLGRARAAILGITASNNDATDIVFLTRYAANGTGLYPSDERMRITKDGKVGINQSSPGGSGLDITTSRTTHYSETTDQRSLANLVLRQTSDAPNRFVGLSFVNGGGTQAEASINLMQTGNYNGDFRFKFRTGGGSTDWRERFRMTAAGMMGFNGNPNRYLHVSGRTDGGNFGTAAFEQNNTNNSAAVMFMSTLRNGSSGESFLQCNRDQDNNGQGVRAVFYIRTNGDVDSDTNSYGGISDIKLKENIVDAKSQWDDIKNIKVRNFNFKDNPNQKMLGVVAQEVETVSAGLVKDCPDENITSPGPEGTSTKSVKYSILYMKAIKALQEAQARIEILEAKVSALEG